MTLAVIVPSRGRPQNIADLIEAWALTETEAALIVAVDDDDPTLDDYLDLTPCEVGPRLRMAGTLNAVATKHAGDYTHLGFMGDDHRPRTLHWDQQVHTELDRLGTGIVYGNDLLQGEALPTAFFLAADIVSTLGWMAPPTLTHLFIDNAILDLGRALNVITYLPDVIIEHVHPVAGKAAWDDGYVEANSDDVWTHDERAYRNWRANHLADDVARIRAAGYV